MYGTLYKGNGVRMTICECCSSEMALNIVLDVSVDNMQDWKGIQ
jgi:hypothetical protein